ncbi:MAG: hypothetical protein JWQ42_3278 [Edaphobacter sp.]|nr:hypothetical protein [Edaphobacter sp.]
MMCVSLPLPSIVKPNSVEGQLDLRNWRGGTNIKELRDVVKWHRKRQQPESISLDGRRDPKSPCRALNDISAFIICMPDRSSTVEHVA